MECKCDFIAIDTLPWMSSNVFMWPYGNVNIFMLNNPWSSISVTHQGLLLLTLFQSNPACISSHTHYTVYDEITYSFPNFNGCTVDVWEWMSNFVSHFTGCVITDPCWDLSSTMLVKWAPQVVHPWPSCWVITWCNSTTCTICPFTIKFTMV